MGKIKTNALNKLKLREAKKLEILYEESEGYDENEPMHHYDLAHKTRTK